MKILVTGAILSKGISPGAQQYSDAEIQAAVIEASRWGRQVAAHAHGAKGIKAAIRAGVRTVDHGSYLDDEAVVLLQQSGRKTFYVPTLTVNEAIEGGATNAPPSEVERSRQIREIMVAGFQRALAAGLPIGFATDSGVTPHGKQCPRVDGAGRIRRDAHVGDRLRDEPERRDHGLVRPRRVDREG